MTKSAVVFTDLKASKEAGTELAEKINEKMEGNIPNVVILFASSVHEYDELLKPLKQLTKTEILIGSSSAGEFTVDSFGTDAACAVAISSTDLKFSAGIAHGIKASRENVADELFKTLQSDNQYQYRYHSAMIFADALSGYTDELIDLLTERTGGSYQFFGGGAGDNANFNRTDVFLNEHSATDSAVILAILSNKPIGVGVSHGWQPAGEKMRVTEVDGMRLISLNAMPAEEVFAEYAAKTNQPFDHQAPIPFFLHNVLGIETSDGYKLRVPLAIQPDGSIIIASDIPAGSYVSFMATDGDSARNAALTAATAALQQIDGHKPNVALFFDCVATRLRIGKDFGFELDQVKETLNAINYAGCNTYGQVARVNGQFSGFHNCTAVVCVIPE
ncbi:MAG: hypothetical protein K0S09_2222 [Sphingobacteriaceae bacterium]|jgi:hypothetical protein|nr:hypothetical protein [Sphingobacteriaceae bacterium]